jgi:hypothetical protein
VIGPSQRTPAVTGEFEPDAAALGISLAQPGQMYTVGAALEDA